MLVNRELILAQIEFTYGTDPNPSAAIDAVLVENLSWANEGLRMNDRPSLRTNIGKLQQIFGGTMRTVTFDVEIKGSGTAGTAPEVGQLLQCCGFGETVVPATSVAYEPVSTGHESCTIYHYVDGKLWIMTGCRGNVSINLETGMQGKMSFTFTGHIAGPTSVAIPSPTLDATVPVAILNGTFSIGAYPAVVNALSFDMANAISAVPDMSASDGYGEVRITARDVNGSYDPEAVLPGVDNPWSELLAGSQLALDTGVIGSVAGNRYQIEAPVVVYRDMTPGDREGVRSYDIPFGCAEDSGDDEISITYT